MSSGQTKGIDWQIPVEFVFVGPDQVSISRLFSKKHHVAKKHISMNGDRRLLLKFMMNANE